MPHITKEIIDIEWTMFHNVRNVGGRADCQDDRETFALMRASQLSAWSAPLRESWLQDLRTAQAEGRDPLSEKYAYMMERTAPLDYAMVRHALPPRSPEKLALIEEICELHVDWLRHLSARFPLLTGRGRGIDKSTDSPTSTSMETYLWGELATYSMDTLQLYLAYARQLREEGKNLNEMILLNTVRLYGFDSLADAEANLNQT